MCLKSAHTKEKALIKQELRAAVNIVIIPAQSSSHQTEASEASRIPDRMGSKGRKLGQCKVNCLLQDPGMKEKKRTTKEEENILFAKIFSL